MIVSEPLRAFSEKLASGWRVMLFAQMLSEPVRNGLYKSKEFHGSGVRVVNMGELFGNDFISNQEMKRVELTDDEEAKFGVRDGDLLFARRSLVLEGSGKCSLVVAPQEVMTFESSIIRARPNRDLAEPRFLFYLFTSPLGRAIVASISTRTAVSGIRGSDLTQLGLPLPPLPVQRQIAGILSAYDDLIGNNMRRIRILEEMARTLYREWFVDFRFPGHEKLPRVASALCDIPQGWEVTTLRTVTTKIGSGATPRGGKDAYKSEGIHLIRSLNIYDYSFEFADLAFIDEQQAAELDNVTVEENDILLNITGASVARCALVPSYLLPARVNQHVAIVRVDPAQASPFYVLDAINSDQRKQQLLALAQGGATREALTKDTVSNFEIILPPGPLMKRYDAVARGIHGQREVLLRQIQNLHRTRNLLLPRLLSGQITFPGN